MRISIIVIVVVSACLLGLIYNSCLGIDIAVSMNRALHFENIKKYESLTSITELKSAVHHVEDLRYELQTLNNQRSQLSLALLAVLILGVTFLVIQLFKRRGAQQR
jgi:hypothetical protein